MQARVVKDEDTLIPVLRDDGSCRGCGRCLRSCGSKKAISMDDILRPVFDTAKCASCVSWNCARVCPNNAITLV
ncbi:MAG: 4Fe-4S dicluster domain-containing protein [Candidatus Odinarchaeota archaeon]